MAWHGEYGFIDAVPAASERVQRRRALTAEEQHQRLREELARASGPRADELRRAVEAAALALRETQLEARATMHRDATPVIDWRALAAMPPPMLPAVDQHRSAEARHRLLHHRPEPYGMVDRRRALQAEVERLIAAEEAERAASMGTWREQMAGWSAWCSLSARILCNDVAAYHEVIAASRGFDELGESFPDEAIRIELGATTAEVELDADADRAIEELRSAALRVVRELLGLLPIASASVRVVTREQSVVELAASRGALESIDWEHVTASEAARRLEPPQGRQRAPRAENV